MPFCFSTMVGQPLGYGVWECGSCEGSIVFHFPCTGGGWYFRLKLVAEPRRWCFEERGGAGEPRRWGAGDQAVVGIQGDTAAYTLRLLKVPRCRDGCGFCSCSSVGHCGKVEPPQLSLLLWCLLSN